MLAANHIELPKATIANGGSESNIIDVHRCLFGSVTCPANVNGISNMSIQHAPWRADWQTIDPALLGFTDLSILSDGNTLYTFNVANNKTVPLDKMVTQELGLIKFMPSPAPGADTVFRLNAKQAR